MIGLWEIELLWDLKKTGNIDAIFLQDNSLKKIWNFLQKNQSYRYRTL